MDPIVTDIEQKINGLIAEEPELFLVEIRLRPTNNIKVFIDGDQGVTIEKLAHYNRRLYRQLEEENLFPNGDFSLELSSPGLDEPLKIQRQYTKNIGRYVEVLANDGSKKEGKLISSSERGIVLEEQKGKGKKMELLQHSIPFENIKMTKVQIKF